MHRGRCARCCLFVCVSFFFLSLLSFISYATPSRAVTPVYYSGTEFRSRAGGINVDPSDRKHTVGVTNGERRRMSG